MKCLRVGITVSAALSRYAAGPSGGPTTEYAARRWGHACPGSPATFLSLMTAASSPAAGPARSGGRRASRGGPRYCARREGNPVVVRPPVAGGAAGRFPGEAVVPWAIEPDPFYAVRTGCTGGAHAEVGRGSHPRHGHHLRYPVPVLAALAHTRTDDATRRVRRAGVSLTLAFVFPTQDTGRLAARRTQPSVAGRAVLSLPPVRAGRLPASASRPERLAPPRSLPSSSPSSGGSAPTTGRASRTRRAA